MTVWWYRPIIIVYYFSIINNKIAYTCRFNYIKFKQIKLLYKNNKAPFWKQPEYFEVLLYAGYDGAGYSISTVQYRTKEFKKSLSMT